MGGFKVPVLTGAGPAATTYYKSGPGLNFGGVCASPACATQALAEKRIAVCVGFVRRFARCVVGWVGLRAY